MHHITFTPVPILRRFASMWLLCGVLWLPALLVWQLTAPGTRDHALFRSSWGEIDFGADVTPTRHGRPGTFELWAHPLTDETETLLFGIRGYTPVDTEHIDTPRAAQGICAARGVSMSPG